jgi:3-deoxy-D-manno-octulosonate 8-phosphate phosphatase (KDO 8-P phosphatase)
MSKLPKIVFTDIDGVWTDGGMYYDQTGNELKRFNTADSAGVILLRAVGIETAIITGENTEIVARRAEKLKIKHLFQGVRNKLSVATEFCNANLIDLKDCAYIGDDLNDLALLKAAGLSCSPANAPEYIKQYAHLVLPVAGGDGAFRAFAEAILVENNLLEMAIERVLESMA